MASSGRFSRYPAINRDIPIRKSSVDVLRTNPEVVGFPFDLEALTVKDILAWVGNDVGRARWALEAEESGKGRATLLKRLGEVAGN